MRALFFYLLFFSLSLPFLLCDVLCPSCQYKNNEEDRYCLNCASELRTLTQAEKEQLEKANRENKKRMEAYVPLMGKSTYFQNLKGKLVNSKGKKVDSKTLEGKTVGLYFSAHWCGPCRSFTPKLVQFRNRFRNQFEVVFVSHDRSEKEQFSYMNEAGMGWPAIKWGSQKAKELKKEHRVSGIPTLVILSSKGKVLTRNGRREVELKGQVYPEEWKK